MTPQSPTPSKTRTSPLERLLGAELLERLDKTRGESAREDYVREALEQRVQADSIEGPVEDLDQAPTRARIKKGGKLYELRNIAEFGPVEQHNLNVDGQQFAKLWQSEKNFADDDPEALRLAMLTDGLFERVLDAPAAVRKQFTPGEKSRVILSFTVAPARQLAQLLSMIEAAQGSEEPGSSPSGTTS